MLDLLTTFLTLAAGFPAAVAAPASAGVSTQAPPALAARIRMAEAFAQQKKFDRTIGLLNPYTDQLTDAGFLDLAHAYSERGEFGEEIRVLGILSGRQEENFRWHMLLGQAYLKSAEGPGPADRHKEGATNAIQHLRRALELNRGFKPAFDMLLNALLAQGAHGEARELIIEGIEKFGERPELMREQCRLDALDGYLPEAVKNCRRSIELSPTYADHFVYLVEALHDEGEDTAAEHDIVAAARRFPGSEFVQWAAGLVFWRKKNYPVATRYFETGVRADPRKSRSQHGLAQALFESHREKDALPHFVEACKLDAGTVEDFLASGGKLKHRGATALAAEYAKAAAGCR